MDKLKYVVAAGLILLLTGCGGNKTLEKSYDKMKIGDSLTEYTVDYRLYGTYNKKNINDIIRIENENGKITATSAMDDLEENKDKKKTDTKKYQDPDLYLTGLNSVTKVVEEKEEKIGETTYNVYNIKVSKKTMEKIIKGTNVDQLKVGETNAKVYLDKDGYVYKVIYELDAGNRLFLNVSYFGLQKK